MIILNEEPNSPVDERSPLKGAEPSPTTSLVTTPPPPPPYSATSHSATLPLRPQTETHTDSYSPPPPPSPVKRFFKAFAVAVLVIFLWSIFFDSLGMAVGRLSGKHPPPHRPPHRPPKGGYGFFMEWLIRPWNVDIVVDKTKSPGLGTPTSTPCPCQQSTGVGTPGRVLPISYPPVVPADPSSALATPLQVVPSPIIVLTTIIPCSSTLATNIPSSPANAAPNI